MSTHYPKSVFVVFSATLTVAVSLSFAQSSAAEDIAAATPIRRTINPDSETLLDDCLVLYDLDTKSLYSLAPNIKRAICQNLVKHAIEASAKAHESQLARYEAIKYEKALMHMPHWFGKDSLPAVQTLIRSELEAHRLYAIMIVTNSAQTFGNDGKELLRRGARDSSTKVRDLATAVLVLPSPKVEPDPQNIDIFFESARHQRLTYDWESTYLDILGADHQIDDSTCKNLCHSKPRRAFEARQQAYLLVLPRVPDRWCGRILSQALLAFPNCIDNDEDITAIVSRLVSCLDSEDIYCQRDAAHALGLLQSRASRSLPALRNGLQKLQLRCGELSPVDIELVGLAYRGAILRISDE